MELASYGHLRRRVSERQVPALPRSPQGGLRDTHLMPTLMDQPTADARRLLHLIGRGWHGAHGHWPVWQFVALSLDAEGIDPDATWQAMPTWQLGYRHVFSSSHGVPGAADPVALTVAGMVHGQHASVLPLVSAYLAALAEADDAQQTITPSPTEVVSLEIDGSRLTERVNVRSGAGVNQAQLLGLLRREPPTWTNLREDGDAFRWELSRLRLRPFRDVRSGEEYLDRLEELVGVASAPRLAAPLPVMALPEALDHLDLAWQVVTGDHLLRVPRAAVAASLTQAVASGDEFESRCTALADLLANLTVDAGDLPRASRPLLRLAAQLEERLGSDAARAVAAVHVLQAVARVRNAQQHSGAAAQNERDRRALGLTGFGTDWAGAWEQLRVRVVDALTVIREEISPLTRP
jgi:hypothetical protein